MLGVRLERGAQRRDSLLGLRRQPRQTETQHHALTYRALQGGLQAAGEELRTRAPERLDMSEKPLVQPVDVVNQRRRRIALRSLPVRAQKGRLVEMLLHAVARIVRRVYHHKRRAALRGVHATLGDSRGPRPAPQ